jgi:hypothetical protein
MEHPIYRVVAYEVVGPYLLRVAFDDGSSQEIDFKNVLEGQLYGPLRDVTLFNQVQIDPEVHTLVWPNGADFDPETLHDWPQYLEDLKKLAKRWALTATPEYPDR